MTALKSLAKVAGLTLLAVFVFLTASALLMPEAAEQVDPAEAAQTMQLMLVVGLVDVLVVLLVVELTEWRGWRLMLGLTVAFYGVQTFLGQIEALFFLTPLAERFGAGQLPQIAFPVEYIGALFLMGIPLALVLGLLPPLLFGKARADGSWDGQVVEPLGWRQWLAKLAIIIPLYILLYLGFGYFVAWKEPAVLEFYGGIDPGSFLAQLGFIASETPGLYGLQALRALLWVGFSFPVIAMVRGRGLIGALTVGVFLALPMNVQHLLPNPYMPDVVRLTHFIETASSNFIFGVVLFWLLHRRHSSVRALFGLRSQVAKPAAEARRAT